MATEQDQDHSHQHPHDHSHHDHDHDSAIFTEKNRSHWNQFAANYTKEQWQKDMINQITEFILSNISWMGVPFIDPSSRFELPSPSNHQVRVLDYACGPGTMTAALVTHATEFVGVDLSENMVNAYNTRFAEATEADSETVNAHAVVGNLLSNSDPNPTSLSSKTFFDFDLAVIGLGFHHFENLEQATKRITARLKPGGVFLILDFLPHERDDTKHPAQHTVAHFGFGEERVRELFHGAGLEDVKIVKMDGEVLMKGLSPRQAFMARGRKGS